MHSKNASKMLTQGMLVLIGLICISIQPANAANFEIADDLLVDLRASDLEKGLVDDWPNRGSLGGVFRADGDPCVVDGYDDWEDYVVYFDGESSFEGPDSTAGIVGNGTRSIEVWAYNIDESKEECMVAWSHRGGGDGTHMAFGYGYKEYGAAGHWGDDYDMGWEDYDDGYPPLETWQYLVYTYDGQTCRLYVNGELNNEKAMDLDTHSGDIIRVGAQNKSDGSGQNFFSGAIAQVRVHDGVLTAAQILNNSQVRVLRMGLASSPVPEKDETDVILRDLELTWSAGEYPCTHTLYFSEDEAAVEDGTAEIASGLTATSYDPGPLSYDTTYYWRVDEVNDSSDGTVYEGKVWNFTTEPYSIEISSDNISVTASSSSTEPNVVIDGTGLTDMAHSTTMDDMWVSDQTDTAPWLLFEFDTIQKLDKMLLWNSNNQLESMVGLGVKEVNIVYSLDGDNWTTLHESLEILQAPGSEDYNTPQEIDLGKARAKYLQIDMLSKWGTMNPAFSVAEVKFYSLILEARDPDPNDGSTEVDVDSTLEWRTGREAAEHHVYFSTDEQAVIDGTAPVEVVSETAYAPALELGTTYYWRVDEVNDATAPSTWTGSVWSFTTVESIVVDDFESYSNSSPYRVFQTWLDGVGYSSDDYYDAYSGNGTGATIGHDIWSGGYDNLMETDIVYSGSSSMPFYYESDSQTDCTLSPAQDWTDYGITTLVIHFYGEADNTGDLYIKIGNKTISYSGDSSDISAEEWITWEIGLTATSASLTSVSDLSIGIDGSNAEGLLYIDDILLK